MIETVKNHLDITLDDDDLNDCYRLGKHEGNIGKPIIVKFMRQKDRNTVYKAKTKLKDVKPALYINEDLTKPIADLYAEVRKLRKDLFIWKCWTASSKIFCTINENDEPEQITCMEDVNKIRLTITPRTPPQEKGY